MNPSESTHKKVNQPPHENICSETPEDYSEYQLPENMMLCGENVPLSKGYNREMFDREFTIAVFDKPQVLMWLKRASRFFPYIEKRLAAAGIPDDFKYLAVAESALHTHIRSKAGALGIWQLMPATAKNLGLRVEHAMDERLCYIRSTDAAIKYLKNLKEIFDSWLLVMAAYNHGENGLHMATLNQGQKDYFQLNLPRETERYIFRIASIKAVLSKPETYGYRPIPERLYQPEKFSMVTVSISKRYSIYNLAHALGISYKVFSELNDKLLTSVLPKGTYTLKIPETYDGDFNDLLKSLEGLPHSKHLQSFGNIYVVQPGDVLSEISWETGISVYRLKKMNNLKNSRIYPGQKLKLK